jgi:hypothetical protein
MARRRKHPKYAIIGLRVNVKKLVLRAMKDLLEMPVTK